MLAQNLWIFTITVVAIILLVYIMNSIEKNTTESQKDNLHIFSILTLICILIFGCILLCFNLSTEPDGHMYKDIYNKGFNDANSKYEKVILNNYSVIDKTTDTRGERYYNSNDELWVRYNEKTTLKLDTLYILKTK